ncbi:MAG: M48 family metalloprotease, partial [Planctomycetaceae bacterium]|nr:M48 family metalloprotease [Planctomycetaceae bacterium]
HSELPSTPATPAVPPPVPISANRRQTPAPTPPPVPPPVPVRPKQPVAGAAKVMVAQNDFLAELEALNTSPQTSPHPAETREEVMRVRQQLHKALDGQLAVTSVPATYRAAVFVVGTLMCLLALVYVGMIVGGVAGMYYYLVWVFNHFDQIVESFTDSNGKGSVFILIVPFIPLLAVGAVLFFMVKPFLFGWRWKDERFELSREREPFLFDFLDKFSAYVGAIPPARVFVDCNVNAAASFRHGIWSALFGGRHCDLTLGLPLVAGMNMSQLVGVIAHEFGHFTQGGGMRFGNIIRTITHWFLRVVYGRDSVDQFIIVFSTSGHIFNIIVFMIVRLFVWMARFVLWCLMMLGFAVSGFLSRQMEFDADQFEARIIGSKSFRNSTRRLLGLGISNAKSNYDVGQMFKDELLVDNYPRLIAANSEIIADLLNKWVDESIKESHKTGWFDTHPSHAARIEYAESLEAEGVIHLECPATFLFDNFDTLARETTWHFYTVENQLDVKQSSLRATGTVIGELKAESDRGKTIGRYWQGLFRDRVAEALPNQVPSVPANPSLCKAEIKAIRERMLKIREPLEKKLEEIGKIENDHWQMRVVTLVQNCKGNYSGMFDKEPPKRSYADNLVKKHQLELERQESIDKTEPEFKLLAKRLHHALSLLMLDPVMRRISDGERLRDRTELLYPLGTRLTQLYQKSFALYQQRILVVMLYASIQKVAQNQLARSLHETEIKNLNDALFEGINSVCNALDEMPYPYDHAQGKVTLKTALLPKFDGTNNDIGYLVDAMEELHGRFGTLLGRIYLELVSLAETVETTIGLPVLPDLPDKEEEKEPEKKKGLIARLLGRYNEAS